MGLKCKEILRRLRLGEVCCSWRTGMKKRLICTNTKENLPERSDILSRDRCEKGATVVSAAIVAPASLVDLPRQATYP